MWSCPVCKRKFNKEDQRHTCSTKDVGELFINRSDELILLYDALASVIGNWDNVEIRAATHSVVFSVGRAFLVLKPMKDQLDLKIYLNEELESELFFKVNKYYGRFQCQIRLQNEWQMTDEFLDLVGLSYNEALQEPKFAYRRKRRKRRLP